MKRFALVLPGLLLLLCVACSTGNPQVPVVAEDVNEWPAGVGVVKAGVPASDALQGLDIGLVVFDPGIPQDTGSHSKLGIFPEIREAEAIYLPFQLREAIAATGAWGAVRVLPRPDKASPVLVTGRILHSDGLQLVIAIEARDAANRVWLDRVYRDEALASDYAPGAEDPFADIYRAISNDLLQAGASFDGRQAGRLADIARLQYAQSLSPEAFSGFLVGGDDGVVRAVRLPAEGDPMLARVDAIRDKEYLFVDTVDEQYRAVYDEMSPTYRLWRQYGRELALYREQYAKRVAGREREGRRGSYTAMQQTYNTYKWSKIHDQDLVEMAGGFENEVVPTVMEIEGRVFKLGGTLDTQYQQWREILRKIFVLEAGLPEPG